MTLSSLEGMVSIQLAATPTPHTPDSIRAAISALRALAMFVDGISDEDAENLARRIEEKQGISMGIGAIVDANDHVPWLRDARSNQDFKDFYWGRYKQLLNKNGLPKSVIDATDEVTEKILDRMGNPAVNTPWNRRGMVVGHVQSGKTSNYIGLACKAADAGYRLIVVIAGIHNNLRNQTQIRIDEGFIGRDTGRIASANKAQKQKIIGVGRFDQSRFPVALTNTLRDFNKATAMGNTSQIGHYNEPVVLVIKKNSSTLKNLLEWLQEYSANTNTLMVSQPLLVIDDEADNASINTAYGKDEITKINGQIRELLSMFHRSCYVGYTATPFANILIDPDTSDTKVKQDLFPRDFIIGLDAPSNYFGAQKIFIDNRDQHIRNITDNDEYLPVKHPKGTTFDALPPSLEEAIRAFIVSRAIRNSRGQKASHASMLINVSRFTDVQGEVRARVADHVSGIKDAVTVHAGRGDDATRNGVIAALYETYMKEYSDCGTLWSEVLGHLHEVMAGIRTVEVNASNRSEPLDYQNSGEYGVTVIAVGGFSLSRGLTLEGLTVSYFLRNSVMYDTLMQMGRWFGYRPKYEDLCRIWILEEGVEWYAHIHEAMGDLQRQLKRMEHTPGATPEQFGLAVRSHPEALMVTARNKMGSGQEYPVEVSLSGKRIETSRLSVVAGTNTTNITTGERLVARLKETSGLGKQIKRGLLYTGIGTDLVLPFLRAFRSDGSDFLTSPELVTKYIEERPNELVSWDVCLASSTVDEVSGLDLGPVSLKPFARKVASGGLAGGIYAIGGANRRIGSPGEDSIGMTDTELAAAEAAVAKEYATGERPKSIPDSFYRSARKRPLLIIRWVAPLDDSEERQPLEVLPLLTWGISFPDSSVQGGRTSYVMNTVRMRELFGDVQDDTDEDVALDV